MLPNKKDTILIVDDESTNISLLTNILQHNYKIKASKDGLKAIIIANKEPKPDVILLDIMMPKMSGYDVIKELKSSDSTKYIPVIFISAMDEAEDETKGFELGAADFITKPITPSVVLARVTTHLELYKYQKELEGLVEEKTIALEQKVHDLEIATQTKANFLASMSHEIRTPMNAILGFIEKLMKDETNIERKKYFKIIQNSGKTLLGIINDILDFSKIESGNLKIHTEETHLKDLFDEICIVYKEKASNKEIDFQCELSSYFPHSIMLDVLHFKQIVFNLLDNALKFTLEGGNVSVDLSFDKEKRLLHCSVSDTGIGISKENFEKIFNIFEQEDNSTTRKYGGTGIGLSIASNIVELMGGNLQLESEVGKGSRFFFHIPITVCQYKENYSERDQDTQEKFEKIKVHALVVEDNKTNQMLMCMMLDDFGITYDIADDGAIAIEKYKANQYDCILMDENMPNMNGIEATKQIRKIELEKDIKPIPIIAVTANSLSGDRERFLAAGMDDYVSKPYTDEDIAKVLQKYLGL